jgi:peptide subunit release factor 1 (eRF1)
MLAGVTQDAETRARRVSRAGVLALCDRIQRLPGRSVYVEGRATFETAEETVELTPTLPLDHQAVYESIETRPLREALQAPLLIAVLAVRLGGDGAGLYRDEQLLDARVGTRFVKNRNKKGGSSSGRFARRRGEQARELHDRAAALAELLLAPVESSIDRLVLAGDRFALTATIERSPLLRRLEARALPGIITVVDPRRRVLEALARELWSSDLRQRSAPA